MMLGGAGGRLDSLWTSTSFLSTILLFTVVLRTARPSQCGGAAWAQFWVRTQENSCPDDLVRSWQPFALWFSLPHFTEKGAFRDQVFWIFEAHLLKCFLWAFGGQSGMLDNQLDTQNIQYVRKCVCVQMCILIVLGYQILNIALVILKAQSWVSDVFLKGKYCCFWTRKLSQSLPLTLWSMEWGHFILDTMMPQLRPAVTLGWPSTPPPPSVGQPLNCL